MPSLKTSYEEQVYAGVLGKVIGVYMGRPIEGWLKAKIEDRWGRADHYLHEDQKVPLVVTDDDISGTLTFIRALEDSGRYAKTPPGFFGDTWLNYLIPFQTVLWWGGMGISTEHTAYLRLKQGLRAPRSGSIATNGRVVAEQIGAQIFIDAFGLVAPGQPELAAKLARRAAGVSHDGEAVHAAVVVAGMIAASFIEKDMTRLLDLGAGLIPADSLIAQVHRDVRMWTAIDRDWRKTYDRIERKYGYHAYGGGCHIAPNHAIMVMAWAYAPDNFHEAQTIINTAGWDTDCNAANVGTLMGVKVGLARINEFYDYQSPFADRILMTTADGTRNASDVLIEALHIARIGRKVMGWPARPAPKGGAWHHFEMPLARHGYLPEAASGPARIENVVAPSGEGSRALRIAFQTGSRRPVRLSTPVYPYQERLALANYPVVGTPRLSAGNRITLQAATGRLTGPVRARLYLVGLDPVTRKPTRRFHGPDKILRSGRQVRLGLIVPDSAGWPMTDLGIELASDRPARGDLLVDRVTKSGGPGLLLKAGRWPMDEKGRALGWIGNEDRICAFAAGHTRAFPAGMTITRNEGFGFLVTGNTDWHDYSIGARFAVHVAERGGLLARFQGLERHLALVKTPTALRLILRYYGEKVLDEIPCLWATDEAHSLRLAVKGTRLSAFCDGKQVMSGTEDQLGSGGAGLLFDSGTIYAGDLAIGPKALRF